MKLSARIKYAELRAIGYESLLSLATSEGINASSKEEIYGCIFGRDSAITIIKMLKVVANPRAKDQIDTEKLLKISRIALLKLCELQGTTINIENGEQPGKFIHEFRKEKYDHLINRERPWFVFQDKTLRNYDSIDSTPLALIAIYRYYEITHDDRFLLSVLPSVEKGLRWMIDYGDLDSDSLIEYEFNKDRKFGGLLVQSWTDSHESIKRTDGTMPKYPIAPVEAQAYAWLTYKLWADFYKKQDKKFSSDLTLQAKRMKKAFNKKFLFKTGGVNFLAQALDGDKNQLRTVTGNALLVLWAAYKKNGKVEAILDDKYISDIVKRSFMADLFDPDGGIRTMSSLSKTYNPGQNSYHNGSFWPVLNSMAHGGLVSFGYREEASKLRMASLKALTYFKTPIELYIKNETGEYQEFRGRNGQVSCKIQAWSAAAVLDLAIHRY